MMFNIEEAFKKSGIGKEDIERIKQYCREEFSDDEMMYELHVIRAINAFKKGYFTRKNGCSFPRVRESKGTYSAKSAGKKK